MAWLLAKKPWIVPIPGTTKLAHLEENLRTVEFALAASEVRELEDAVSKISIVGDRYSAVEQKRISR
jgi:aryl-alcohol dehydrogenase-like predicted oxidoreductase